jgi:hypothetical protein
MSILVKHSRVYRFSNKDIAKTKRKITQGEIAADFVDYHPILKSTEQRHESEDEQKPPQANKSESEISYDSSSSFISSGSEDEFPPALVHAASAPLIETSSTIPPMRRRLSSLTVLRVPTKAVEDTIPTEPLEPYTLDRLRKMHEEHQAELDLQNKKKRCNGKLDAILGNDVVFYSGLLILLFVWTVLVIQILLTVPEEWATPTALGIIVVTLGSLGGFAYFNPELVDKILQ